MRIDFRNQVVLITGGTRGIGSAIASDFEKLGARLILTGTKKDEIDRLNKIHKGRKRRYYCVDFADKESTQDFLDELGKYKKIDVCVNNAGTNRINEVDKIEIRDVDDIISVNLRSPILITSRVSRIMKKNNYGRIVNISSIFGVISRGKRSLYSATKFGIRGLTIASSIDLAKYNILVNSVSPGFVLTDLTRRMLTSAEMKALVSEIPLRRFARPDEISKVVIFLASRMNTYITGQNMIVDGGYVNV